jgi:hypothetical protein
LFFLCKSDGATEVVSGIPSRKWTLPLAIIPRAQESQRLGAVLVAVLATVCIRLSNAVAKICVRLEFTVVILCLNEILMTRNE